MDAVFLLIGIILLSIGGEALIRGALGAAERLNVSPLLCGIFIVGFGTSAPELVVSINAAMSGNSDIAIGNVVGSNIGNILLILGICALITPLKVKPKVLSRDASTTVMASLLFSILVYFNGLNAWGGTLLFAGLISYLAWVYFDERLETSPPAKLHISESKEVTIRPKSIALILFAIIVGLILLIFGSQVLLKGAIGIAQFYNVSDSTIGLTLIAVGTSLPELSISVIAAFRKHTDVAVGNVLGSNIFNVLGILGISTFIQPLSASTRVVYFDQWVMLATSILLILFLYFGRIVGRFSGALLLLVYVIYLLVGLHFFNV